jgi:hypothetical protein
MAGVEVGDCPAHYFNFIGCVGKILLLAGGEIIEDEDGVAATNQLIHCVRTNKTGATSDDVTHLAGLPAGLELARSG